MRYHQRYVRVTREKARIDLVVDRPRGSWSGTVVRAVYLAEIEKPCIAMRDLICNCQTTNIAVERRLHVSFNRSLLFVSAFRSALISAADHPPDKFSKREETSCAQDICFVHNFNRMTLVAKSSRLLHAKPGNPMDSFLAAVLLIDDLGSLSYFPFFFYGIVRQNDTLLLL